MDNYNRIHDKLRDFIRRYYANEMIKGSILFLSFGLLYLIFTLTVEYFLWLKPLARTILFWLFVGFELGLLFWFIVLPLLKLWGIKNGITEMEASRIIGRHFAEVDDKLLNILQLRKNRADTDLLEASIEQKSKELETITFKRAINFNKNRAYIKYLLIPVFIWFIIWATGNNSVLTQSLNRVVHHKTAFIPPAPFYFEIINEKLETIEDQTFVLKFKTIGEVIPENIRIIYNGQSFYINSVENDVLNHAFEFPGNDVEFYLEGNKVRSQLYTLKVVAAPKIIDFNMELRYPAYLNKDPDTISNTGNAVIPAGTEVSWHVSSQNTKTLDFVINESKEPATVPGRIEKMRSDELGVFSLTRRVDKNMSYEIRSSNEQLKDFEKLSYELEVVRDEYPKIFVRSDIDSVSRTPIQFFGQLTDDYGLTRLQVMAKNRENGAQSIGQIEIGKGDFEEFLYNFPSGLVLEEGNSYEIFFEIFDNDAIRGPKKSVSQTFLYHNKTQDEEEEEILKEQKEGMEEMENARESGEKMEKSLEEFSKKLKNKEKTDWNDKKELDEFLERQKSYQDMMDKNSEKMMKNFDEMDDENNPLLEEKKEELKKRIEEMKAYKEKEELIKELQKLADKLEKEDLLERIDKLKEQSKQEKRTLERILELTKQFYVEKKSAQIMKQLDELSEEQLELSNDEMNSMKEQEKLNEKFDSIQKDFEEMREQNDQLKSPLDIFDSEPDEKLIEMDMKAAEKSLEKAGEDSEAEKEHKDKAAEKQKTASKRMKELSKKMESGLLEMEMQGMEENILDLQQVLKNLLKFSLDQEKVMLSFEDVSDKNADYPEKLKEQIMLKEYFEHIDDSLYALSLRMVKMSSKIQEDLSAAHYNLNKSLENIAENRIQQGMTNQHYTMTAANNLADLLSDMLQNLQNQSPGSGKGKGKEGELSLPDIIKQQQEMMERMKEGMDAKKGQGKQGKEEMSGEQYEMYQQQKLIKDQMQQLLEQEGKEGQSGKSVLEQMDNLEKILLEKGITNDAIQRMQELEHELLELENANLKRNEDSKRKATSGEQREENREIEELDLKKYQVNEDEMLKRQRLDLSPDYKRKVKRYFETEKK